MRQDVIQRQQAAMAAAGLDALIAITPENFAYVTGFIVPSVPILRWRHCMAVVTRAGQVSLVSVDMEASTIRAKAPGVDVRVWGEFTDRPMAILAKLLTDLELTMGAVGIETDYLPVRDADELRSLLPKLRVQSAEGIFDQLRQQKTPDEIELLRRLSRIADEAIADSFRAVRAGMTELDLGAALIKGIYARGAEHFKIMIVATGERSEFPNVGPTKRVLTRGDLCRVEIFPTIAGYQSGVCRTAVVQAAPERALTIYRNLVECKYLVMDMIKPGASTRTIYDAFLKKFSELGLPSISFVGHGIGLHLHEEPYLGKYSDSRLEEGMVLGIEPLVYGAGMGFGLQLKDMVLVTSTGCELLSDSTNTDEILMVA
jgi:Xaa-Pro aminopeptidase